jgi:hypothetical protein
MKTWMPLCCLPVLAVIIVCCNSETVEPVLSSTKLEVVVNDIPYKTEQYLRIPYMLRMWEYAKDGLTLQKIEVLDDVSKAVLLTLDKSQFPRIHKDPIPPNPIFVSDTLKGCYTSIQLPIPLNQAPPARVSHRLTLRDTIRNVEVVVRGGVFLPRLGENPLVIGSPVKGRNQIIFNQSTNEYHFYTAFFIGGNIWRGERFAFDNVRVDDDFTNSYTGDINVNENHYCYHDTLYAVADGTVQSMATDQLENHGSLHDVPMTTAISYAGNYIIIDIGNGRYAFYAHCATNSAFVTVGQQVKKGDPLALLGNSGNSDMPHLHFQICDRPDFFFSIAVPFVLEKLTIIGAGGLHVTPVQYTNCMPEMWDIVNIE